MMVIPAIDIRGGKVVRLAQGAADKETVYYDSPLDVAMMWQEAGARLIHVVDLDGAMEGRLKNLPLVEKMVKLVSAKIELGGGMRDIDTIKRVLDAGIEKAVIGTRALDDTFIADIAKRFGPRIVVGIDAKDGIVHTKGWVEKTELKAADLVRKISRSGIRTINYTDISKDGMMKGPNIESLKKILELSSIDVIASGGVSTLEDVKRLKALESKGLKGMIIGKALYEKKIDLKEAIKVCSQNG